MKYHVQACFNQFICTGAECEDTCCKGWCIPIDKKSYQRYLRVKGAFGRRLFRGIEHKKRCFRMRGSVCTFLNRAGFCDIYKELGRKGMCKSCREYPRHREDYGQLQEVMLSLSCPEAARLILSDETQGMWREKERMVIAEEQRAKEGDEPATDLVEDLEELRQTMVCLIKDRSIEWRQRLAMMLALAHDFQRHWNKIQKAGYPYSEQRRRQWAKRLSQRYLSRTAAGRFARRIERIRAGEREREIRIAAWMRLMREMEPVLNDWKEQWDRICSSLYHQRSIKEYQAFCQQFERASADLEQEWENLAIYFVNTYMLGAVYDEDVYGKAKLVVFGSFIIREWSLFRYAIKGRIDRAELVGTAYRYSREVENSDQNLEFLEEQLKKNPLFGLNEMLKVVV
ncbi:MAG: hypothetical protein HFG57_02220 [Lachnospiraceae bacterium]|nr:hypothetical protein [Lachnospiraceae bacterium]